MNNIFSLKSYFFFFFIIFFIDKTLIKILIFNNSYININTIFYIDFFFIMKEYKTFLAVLVIAIELTLRHNIFHKL